MYLYIEFFSLDDFLNKAIVMAYKHGMSFDDISALLTEKSVVCDCMAKLEKSGLIKQPLEVLKILMEEKQ